MTPGDFHSDQGPPPRDSPREQAPHDPEAQKTAPRVEIPPHHDHQPRSSKKTDPNAPDSDSTQNEIDPILPQLPESSRVEQSMATLALDPATLKGAKSARSSEPHAGQLDGDSEIMLRVQSGDDAAFNLLVEKYHRPMTHYMYRMTHNQAVAEELAQEVFLRVFRSRESYRAEARFSTWLYRIATNLGVNYARDTRRERTAHTVYLDQRDPETGTTPDVADSRPSAEHDLVQDERMQAIRKHVMALPERQRNAVLMHKYQGLDYRQIGEIMKLSESATKSLLFRAYQTLRVRLKEFVENN